jgi:glutamate dehydrogenase/leucine dehydrogenase
MEGALDFLSMGPLSDKRVVMQGIGNVGSEMVELLLDRGVASIVASDISAERTQELAARCRDPRLRVQLVSPGDTSVFEEPCDVFAPNALGGVLDPETIRKLRTRIVCGAANNQLLDDARDGELLRAKGIVYVPDFVANRMGIVNCANEQYGVLPNDPAIERHYGRDWDNAIFVVTRRVLERAAREATTPTVAANALADELGLQAHPIFGHRVRAIINALVAEAWEKA